MALVLVDAAMLALAVGCAGALRLQLEHVAPVTGLGWHERHVVASVLLLPLLLLFFHMRGLYEIDHLLVGTREYAQVASAATHGMLVTLAVSYFAGGAPLVSRSWLVLAWAFSIGCVVTGRCAGRRVVRWLRRGGALRTRVAVIGASTLGVAIAEQLRAAEDEGLNVVGFVDEYLPLGQVLLPGAPGVPGVAVIGRPTDLLGAHAGRLRGGPALADEYVLVPQALPHQRLEEITRLMLSPSGPPLRLAVNSTDLLTHGVLIVERGGVPLVTLRPARIGGVEAALKRTLDLVGATLALIVLALPALAALARARRRCQGPLICRYPVYGAGGTPITLYLLDTNVASWLPLRGVPALLLVLAGRLSLVGPRPALWQPEEPRSRVLWATAVKPGVTGPWRLGGPEASLDDQATRDLTYVRNYSIWEDARILWRSVQSLMSNPLMPLLARWHEHGELPELRAPLPPATLAPDGV